MRVPESRMVEIASTAMFSARDAAGKATETMSSGVRVEKPSDDPVAWAESERAQASLAANTTRGGALQRSQDRLQESDSALQTVDDLLLRARDIATQQANGAYNASDRAQAATEMQGIRNDVLAALNTRSAEDGEYVFAGARGDAPAFNPTTGTFQGDASLRTIDTAPGATRAVTVSGAMFTQANGVDVLGVLATITTALDQNDPTTVSNQLDNLQTAQGQVATARSQIGYAQNALDGASSAKAALDLQLQAVKSKLIEADPISAATDLAQTKNALDAATAAAQQVLAMAQTKSLA